MPIQAIFLHGIPFSNFTDFVGGEADTGHSVCVEVRGQLAGIGSPFLPCEIGGLNSGPRVIFKNLCVKLSRSFIMA